MPRRNVDCMSSFLDLLMDGAEMGERVRAFDWAPTPLGPPDGWPQSLRTIVRTFRVSGLVGRRSPKTCDSYAAGR